MAANPTLDFNKFFASKALCDQIRKNRPNLLDESGAQNILNAPMVGLDSQGTIHTRLQRNKNLLFIEPKSSFSEAIKRGRCSDLGSQGMEDPPTGLESHDRGDPSMGPESHNKGRVVYDDDLIMM